MKTHYQLLIIGGGTAGIMVAAQMKKKKPNLEIGLIEPADTHYYQPAWTLVGAGTYDFNKTAKPMADLIPKGVTWVKDYATIFKPEENLVSTKNSSDFTYDYLVVAPGLVMAPELIEGLPEALDKGVVCSNYTDPLHTWDVIKNFKGGNAVFTQPTTPIKCGGAPQKIAYLAADYFKKNGIANKTNLVFATPGTVIFGIKPIRDTLMKVIHRYGIHFKPFYAPFKIDPDKKIVYFKNTATDENQPFDMLHLAPPQTAPQFIKDSPLVNKDNWLDVDHFSLQHNSYKNIFGLGDVAALPTAKTGAAIRKQVPVVVDNLALLIDHKEASNKNYNGYSSCPLVTGFGKMTLAEFDY
ncbi:UNVERIFIED_CONTAM: hypothetical protein GTU68_051937, partial [Idotea baltica]|nr:hypothetical protein [Idotea baltica]